MNKQQFLAISLPHELLMKSKTFSRRRKDIEVLKPSNYNTMLALGRLPICHPPSDLTKPITHKGETFVPMIKLLEMEQSLGLKYATINHKVIKIDTVKSEDYGSTYEVEYTEPYGNMEDGLIQFSYSERFRRFGKIMFQPFRQPLGVGYQLDLFLKLIEWHFNLMDESEPFIDVNTLQENRYK